MYKKGTTPYPEAQKRAHKWFEDGCPGSAQLFFSKELVKGLPEDETPKALNWLYRERKKWQRDKAKAVDVAVETGATKGKVTFVEGIKPPRSRGDIYRLTEAPELDELVNDGVPPKLAPRLMADWDTAYSAGDRYQATVFKRMVEVLKDFPGITYDKARALAELELRADELGFEEDKSLVKLIRRYRPWESKQNQQAFNEMHKRWLSSSKASMGMKAGEKPLERSWKGFSRRVAEELHSDRGDQA